MKDQDDTTFDLFENKGRRTLLSFHSLAWTPFCDSRMKSLEDNLDTFSSLNTVGVGTSVGSVPWKKNAWAENLGISTTQLLCGF